MAILIDFLVVPFLIIFGFLTSYEDTKHGLIRNKWVLAGIFYGIGALIAQLVYLSWTGAPFPLQYVTVLGTNLAVGALLAIGLWLGHMWSAADAKLYIAYLFVFPLHWYQLAIIPAVPVLEILVNAVIPLGAYLMLLNMRKLATDAKSRKAFLQKKLQPKKHVELLFFLFGFLWILEMVVGLLPGGTPAVSLALMIPLFLLAVKFLGDRLVRLSALASLARLLFDHTSITAEGKLLEFVIFYLIIDAIFMLIPETSTLSDKYRIQDLRPHMIPAKDIRGVKTKEGLKYTIGAKKGKSLFIHRAEGIREEEIILLKGLATRGRLPFTTIPIARSIPFAPFLAGGVLLTAIFGSNLLLLL